MVRRKDSFECPTSGYGGFRMVLVIISQSDYDNETCSILLSLQYMQHLFHGMALLGTAGSPRSAAECSLSH